MVDVISFKAEQQLASETGKSMSLNDYSVWTSSRYSGRHHTPSAIRSWLLDQGSLTKRLQNACPGRFRVQVLNQCYALPFSHERQVLSIKDGLWCFIRQVHLYCDETPVVYARTVVPIDHLAGAERRLTLLGSKPLGGLLFSDPNVRRDSMQVSVINKGRAIYRAAVENTGSAPDQIWGRRSVFYMNGKKLLVSEIFLPSVTSIEL